MDHLVAIDTLNAIYTRASHAQDHGHTDPNLPVVV